jgi:predicted RecA/RadA family phage recombinase
MATATPIKDGEVIDYTAGGTIAYLDVVSLVTRIGVAAADIANGAVGELHVEGIFEIAAVTNASFAVGDALYYDVSGGVLTKTSQGNIPAGWCVAVKATQTATARVKIG